MAKSDAAIARYVIAPFNCYKYCIILERCKPIRKTYKYYNGYDNPFATELT